MENLNAENVKKWLEICAEDTPYPAQSQALLEALAFINSQEQRIKELTEENERLRAEQVKHGQWITRNVRGIDIEVKCSVCGSRDYYPVEYNNVRYPNYCCDCGAKNERRMI